MRSDEVGRAVAEHLAGRESEILDDLREFVTRETPSTEKPLLDDFADFLSRFASELGAEIEIVKAEGSGDHVLSRWRASRERDEAPVFLLGHYDTVWESGTISKMPFEVRDGRATGPGIFDMKCGLVQGFWAIRALRELDALDRDIVFLCNSDEEIGSPTSRILIENLARNASHALVLEPSLDGALKTARKGVGTFEVTVTGRPSHAGLRPEDGVSAIDELVRLVEKMKEIADPKTGTTVNIGTISGGTRSNVIAAEARAEIDVRVATHDEAGRVKREFLNLETEDPEASVHVEGTLTWPPMERDAKMERMFDLARRRAASIGLDLQEGFAGGASDGCHCAAVGAAVIDGLGAVGGGAHAPDEHIEVDRLIERIALIAALIPERIGPDGPVEPA